MVWLFSFQIEQIANVVTHGIWIIPALCCAIQLLWRSDNTSKIFVAMVYGISLILLFFVSTFFHCAFYCNNNRQLRDILHRCDRAMIYIFIAGSYFPWLSLSSPAHSNMLTFLKWFVWTLAALGILYQQVNENYSIEIYSPYFIIHCICHLSIFRSSTNDTDVWRPSCTLLWG